MSVPVEGLLPDSPLLTVEEAADVLRIGRSKAYGLTAEYVRSDGTSGAPVIRLGGCLRVPRGADRTDRGTHRTTHRPTRDGRAR